jgi:four helix bundle protein
MVILNPSFHTLDSPEANMKQFDHEKLKVYHATITFVSWVSDLLTDIPKSISVHNQFDRASTSIPLNIAEGNGKYTSADRCRFFDNARGSALECAACLDVLVAKSLVEQTVAMEGKEMLIEIVSMLVGLIRSNSPSRDA